MLSVEFDGSHTLAKSGEMIGQTVRGEKPATPLMSYFVK